MSADDWRDEADRDDVDQVDDDAGEESPITGQRMRVTFGDGRVVDVVVQNRDYLAWDMTAPRRKWNAQTQPFLFANFLAYSALKRTGEFDGTFDGREEGSWWNSVDDVDQRVSVPVPPTPPAADHA